jgi:hypothetical protein
MFIKPNPQCIGNSPCPAANARPATPNLRKSSIPCLFDGERAYSLQPRLQGER